MGAQRAELLLVANSHLGDRRELLLLEGVHQQREWFDAGLLRLQVVAVFVVDGVDLLSLDEGR